MTDSNKSRKRNSLPEFTLPSVISAAVIDCIGMRKMAKTTQEGKAAIMQAINTAATEIAKALGADQPAKRRAPRKQAGDGDGSASATE